MANAIYTLYLAIRIADADNCPQNLATFGVGTNVKSIPLTSKHHWGGSSNLELPGHTNIKVNRIDLINSANGIGHLMNLIGLNTNMA